MPRPQLSARLARLDAEIAQLQASIAAGQTATGARGCLRRLQAKRAWYAARYTPAQPGARRFGFTAPLARRLADVAPDLGLDLADLL